MQLHLSPTRLEFSAAERNAAQRALLRLVTDFGLVIEASEREWCMPLGSETARIRLESGMPDEAHSPLPLETSVCFKASNPAGAQLLELLYTSLRREWQNPQKGPTHRRHTVNRAQADAVMRILG